MTYKQIAKDIV